ncbi:MAG: endonuclease [Rhodothermales bacterium]
MIPRYLAALAALVLSFCLASPASAEVLVVPTDYPTISAAVGAAAAGDTVFVLDGVYRGGIPLKSHVTLLGQSNTGTIIDGDLFDAHAGFDFYWDQHPGYGREGVVVQNFRIRNFPRAVRFADNESHDPLDLGIAIRNNVVEGCGTAFYLSWNAGGAAALIEGNVLYGPSPGSGVGMSFTRAGETVRVTGNRIYDFGTGISSDTYSRITIDHNVIVGSSAQGLYLSGTTTRALNNTLVENEIAVRVSHDDAYLRSNVFAGNATAVTNYFGDIDPAYNVYWDNGSDGGYTDPTDTHGDPLLTGGDYYWLGAGSAAIDAGDPSADFVFEPRPNGGRVNAGAYGNTPLATVSSPEVAVEPAALDFGVVSAPAELALTVRNEGATRLLFGGVEVDGPTGAFDVVSAPAVLMPGEEGHIAVAFDPPSPGPYTGTLRIETNDADEPVVDVALTGVRQTVHVLFPHLIGPALADSLAAYYGPSSVLPQDAAADTLFAAIARVTDVDGDGVRGLYSDLFVPFDCNPSCDPSADVYDGGEGLELEPLWPLSLVPGNERVERDLHHLFPARVEVQADRGTLPFGESPDDETTEWYHLDETRGTPPEAGRDAWSERLGGVRFEPRESTKGDVARALFYVYAVYGPSGSGQADPTFFELMKDTLLAWHEADPASEEEGGRSERVAAYQTTRSGEPAVNPFVHDPTLARRAYSSESLARPRLYVDQAAADGFDGSGWDRAFPHVQTALAVAEAFADEVAEVWVAEGTYRPGDATAMTGGRRASFHLKSGVAVYGGFAGHEGELDERDLTAHVTVLSGDLDGDGEAAGNAYHVVTATEADSTTVLDGFTITMGNTLDAEFARGGGLYVTGGAPVLRHLTIAQNVAAGGGGMYVEAGSPLLFDVAFVRNTAFLFGSGTGGGLSLSGGSATVINARFYSNRAGTGGGGLTVSNGGTPLIVNSAFVANDGGPIGGAVYSLHSDPVLVNVVATRNEVFEQGGALFSVGATSEGGGDPVVRNGVFWDNDGGEIGTVNASVPDVAHSIVQGGYAGGTVVLTSNPRFVRQPGTDGPDDYGDLRLQEGSPGVDFGLAEYLPLDRWDVDGDGDTAEPLPIDLASAPRLQGNAVDLGAYESAFAVASEPAGAAPAVDALEAAYPSPFRTRTVLALTVADAQAVTVEAFDVLGRRVAVLHDGEVRPGERREVVLDGRALPAGVYVVRARGEGLTLVRRVTLVR